MQGSPHRRLCKALPPGAPFFALFLYLAVGLRPANASEISPHWVLKAKARAALLRGAELPSTSIDSEPTFFIPLPRRRVLHLYVPRAYFPDGAWVLAGRSTKVLVEKSLALPDEPGVTIDSAVDWVALAPPRPQAVPQLKPLRTRLLGVIAAAQKSSSGKREFRPEPDPILRLGNYEWDLEVLDRPEDHQRGMMFRTAIDPHHLMVFDFGRPQTLSFWMKNCRVPIDVAFVTAERRVLDVHTMTPPGSGARTFPTWDSSAPARYALEGRGGTFKQRGLKPGVSLKLP